MILGHNYDPTFEYKLELLLEPKMYATIKDGLNGMKNCTEEEFNEAWYTMQDYIDFQFEAEAGDDYRGDWYLKKFDA